MGTIKITEILENARKGKIPFSLKLVDASRYASNSVGELTVNTDIFYSGRVHDNFPTDELIIFDKKTLNVSELQRILKQFIGRGEVRISTKDGIYQGEVKDE